MPALTLTHAHPQHAPAPSPSWLKVWPAEIFQLAPAPWVGAFLAVGGAWGGCPACGAALGRGQAQELQQHRVRRPEARSRQRHRSIHSWPVQSQAVRGVVLRRRGGSKRARARASSRRPSARCRRSGRSGQGQATYSPVAAGGSAYWRVNGQPSLEVHGQPRERASRLRGGIWDPTALASPAALAVYVQPVNFGNSSPSALAPPPRGGVRVVRKGSAQRRRSRRSSGQPPARRVRRPEARSHCSTSGQAGQSSIGADAGGTSQMKLDRGPSRRLLRSSRRRWTRASPVAL